MRARVRQYVRRASAGDPPQDAAFGDAEGLQVTWCVAPTQSPNSQSSRTTRSGPACASAREAGPIDYGFAGGCPRACVAHVRTLSENC